MSRLIIVVGDEGAGKSTIVRALSSRTPNGAQLDAEDVGQVAACRFDDAFFDLLRRNVAAVVRNFWAAGHRNVVAGSFLRDYADYVAFRALLPQPSEVFVVELLVAKPVRDGRRRTRSKQTTQEWRDKVDVADSEDATIRQAAGDYRYAGIDTTQLSVAETLARVEDAIPEIYGAGSARDRHTA
jgi:ABC-type cobalamin/Fe3+-siderophores transport system ATPase subunit